jgi:hypothetical protein
VKRGGWIRRTTPLKSTTKGLSPRIRALVLDRDLFGCSYCGDGPSRISDRGLRLEIHHRLPKGRGGKDSPDNLVTICGLGNAAGCHRSMDQNRAAALARGFVLHTGQDPLDVPAVYHDEVAWLLLRDATRIPAQAVA